MAEAAAPPSAPDRPASAVRRKIQYAGRVNMAEAAAPPSAPDRPASAVRRKIQYAGRVIKDTGRTVNLTAYRLFFAVIFLSFGHQIPSTVTSKYNLRSAGRKCGGMPPSSVLFPQQSKSVRVRTQRTLV